MPEYALEISEICAIAAITSLLLKGSRYLPVLRFMIGIRLLSTMTGILECFTRMF